MSGTLKSFKEEYRRASRKKILFILLFVVITVFLFFYTLTIGLFEISLIDTIRVIINHIMGNITDPQADDIIWNIRLPEAIMAIIVGATLAVAGAVMQTLLRNPLADPYTMGISSGASFGVALSIILGFGVVSGISGTVATILNAFVFAMIPLALILVLSRKKSMTSVKIILSGVAIMYVFSAFTTLLMITAESESLAEVYAWNVGTLSRVEWSFIPIAGIISLVCISLIYTQYKKYNVMIGGSNVASCLGVPPKKTMLIGLGLVSLMTAAAVCFTGTIGFIGLIGPHVARIFVRADSKFLIPASAMFGSAFLLGASSIAKIAGDMGLPVGVVSTLIGCPLFIFLLIKMGKKVW